MRNASAERLAPAEKAFLAPRLFMSYAAILISVATLWTLAVVSPGPNFLLTARLAIARPKRQAMQAVGGIALGTILWGASGCFGVQALFVAAPWMYLSIKVAGAAYLVLLGLQLLWRVSKREGDGASEVGEGRRRLPPFQIGFLTTLANPRSAVSVASIFATTMPSSPPLLLSLAVIALMTVISISWYAAIALLFAAPTFAERYRRFRRWIDGVVGACLITFGSKLALEP
jgi:threonine efflux protein